MTKTGTITIESFELSALEQLSKIIGDRYTGSGITNFFHKAGFTKYQHDGTTKWRFVYEVLQDIQSIPSGQYHIIKIIQLLCNPQEYINNGDYHEEIVGQVNEIIKFYGLKISLETGQIVYTGKKDTRLNRNSQEVKAFDSRNYHEEIRKHGRELFAEGRYFHAVFECCKAFDKYVADKAKLDKHGSDLMSAALSMKGSLKLNKQVTETDRNEQEGIMHLCMGVMRAIRNPKGHELALEWPIDVKDALDILSLLSFLFRQIDKSIYWG